MNTKLLIVIRTVCKVKEKWFGSSWSLLNKFLEAFTKESIPKTQSEQAIFIKREKEKTIYYRNDKVLGHIRWTVREAMNG